VRVLLVFFSAGCLLSATPKVASDGIRNAASYSNRGDLNSGIAQGSIFAIFGDGLGPEAAVETQSLPLPQTLAEVSVEIKAGSTTNFAYLFCVSARQISALLPSGTPLGNATVTVVYRGERSSPAAVVVAIRKVGLFTLNQGGSGPAVAQNFISSQNQPFNSLLAPAHPGQVVTLWATGMGAVQGDEAGAAQPGDLGPISLYVGAVQAHVEYAGGRVVV
jgi:uncharacterized protein (TIGR03437 family)